MKPSPVNYSKEKEPNFDLEFLLRTNGYLFPETIEEVIEFEKKFGNTKMMLPEELQNTSFLDNDTSLNNNCYEVASIEENYAVAARLENGSQLPDHIKKRMEEDKNKKLKNSESR